LNAVVFDVGQAQAQGVDQSDNRLVRWVSLRVFNVADCLRIAVGKACQNHLTELEGLALLPEELPQVHTTIFGNLDRILGTQGHALQKKMGLSRKADLVAKHCITTGYGRECDRHYVPWLVGSLQVDATRSLHAGERSMLFAKKTRQTKKESKMAERELTAGQEIQILRAELTVPKIARTRFEKIKFFGMNLLLIPLVVVIYITINAEGLRAFMPFFGMPAYRLPIPGFSVLQEYDGWDRLDLGHITAFGLLILLSWIWAWVVKHLANGGDAEFEREIRPVLFYIWTLVSTALIGIEAAVFFAGLVSFGGGLWSSTSWAVAFGVTALYMLGMLCIAKWHNDFKYGG